MMTKKIEALLLVDLQYDFLPGGALAVREGDEVLPVARSLMALKGQRFDYLVATQDWHPRDHESFASQHAGRKPGEMIDLHGLPQVLWPNHCVQGTHGAELAILSASGGPQWPALDFIAQKGKDRTVDSYSGFFDNGRRKKTELEDYLRARGVTHLSVMGLATDYCVKFTALDAKELGFEVELVERGCRGVNLKPQDSAQALQTMQERGIRLV